MWQTTRNNHNPFLGPTTPIETFAYVASFIPLAKCWGVEHRPQHSPHSLIVPTLYSGDRGFFADHRRSGCGFLSRRLFKTDTSLDLQPWTSALSVNGDLSSGWPTSTAASRSRFCFNVATSDVIANLLSQQSDETRPRPP